jgi:predicted nucleic acid-binding protein
VSFLFDTNALSETFRRRPNPGFVRWLETLPPDLQFTSTVVIAELYVAAYRSAAPEKWLRRIRGAVLPALSVIPFDLDCAHACGRIQAGLMDRGTPIESADVQIAATALRYQLTLVTANVRHFDRIPELQILAFEPGETGRFRPP